jgi:hypothetical protein
MTRLRNVATWAVGMLSALMLSIGMGAAPAYASTSPEEPGTGWEVTSDTYPTHVRSGGKAYLEVNVYNTGAKPSVGPVTVTDVLPEGVTATVAGDHQIGPEESIGGLNLWDCGGIGTSVVTCTSNRETLPTIPLPERSETPGAEGNGVIAHLAIGVIVNTPEPATLRNHVTVSGGGAPAPASTEAPIMVTAFAPDFGFQALDGWASNANGTTDSQAGSHPYKVTFSLKLNTVRNRGERGLSIPAGGEPETIAAYLPPGLVGNPTAVPRCGRQQFDEQECPASTQVGVDWAALVSFGSATTVGEGLPLPVYNLVPPPGIPAQFGFELAHVQQFIDAGVRSGGDYGLTATVHSIVQKQVYGNSITIWGEPADPSHDDERYVSYKVCQEGCKSDGPRTPFLTLPTACGGPETFRASASAWGTGAFAEGSFMSHDSGFAPAGIGGCDHLGFGPSISVAPDTASADTPAGVTVDVRVPQEGLLSREGLAMSNIKDTTVVLPAGFVINPGQAAGLQACQAGPTEESASGFVGHPGRDDLPLAGEDGEEERFAGPADCPGASKVGTVKITTPLLSESLEGDVFVLQSNPPDVKLLVAASGEGVNLKLVGDAELCETTGQVIHGTRCEAPGQLITTFAKTPELPFTDFKLSFSGGAQAALDTPTHCGEYTTTSDFTPWSTPAVGDAFPSSSFQVASGTGGAACPAGVLPFAPSMVAGSTSDQAGAFTGFSLLLQRGDDQQRVEKLSFKEPAGLAGLISSVPLCQEPQAAAGTCSASSQIGHAVVSSGPGPFPLTLPQPGAPELPIYLTGPYEGAPFGLSIVTPVVAGPFNLGTIVTRARIEVDPRTAQITIATDPLPQIVKGVPTDLRSIDSVIDRPNFLFNPTNCAPAQFTGTAWGTAPPGASEPGQTAPLSSHFGIGSCRELGFTPKFHVSTSGKTSKSLGASLTATVSEPAGAFGKQANISFVKVELPKQLPSRLTTLQKACLAAVFNANPANCPSASVIGHAKVITPVLPVPLEGPAIFVSHGNEAFPSLTMVLQGDNITIDLVGTTFISKAGITSTTFKTVPDTPFNTFSLTLPEGRFSALTANGNLCASKLVMPNEFKAQNGLEIHQSTPIEVTGCKPAIRVVKHSVSGRTATLVVSVPAAGKLVGTGKGLSKGTGKIGKAGTVTVKLTLSKSQQAFLAKHHGRKLKATVKLTFTPKKGAKLKTTTSVLIA